MEVTPPPPSLSAGPIHPSLSSLVTVVGLVPRQIDWGRNVFLRWGRRASIHPTVRVRTNFQCTRSGRMPAPFQVFSDHCAVPTRFCCCCANAGNDQHSPKKRETLFSRKYLFSWQHFPVALLVEKIRMVHYSLFIFQSLAQPCLKCATTSLVSLCSFKATLLIPCCSGVKF